MGAPNDNPTTTIIRTVEFEAGRARDAQFVKSMSDYAEAGWEGAVGDDERMFWDAGFSRGFKAACEALPAALNPTLVAQSREWVTPRVSKLADALYALERSGDLWPNPTGETPTQFVHRAERLIATGLFTAPAATPAQVSHDRLGAASLAATGIIERFVDPHIAQARTDPERSSHEGFSNDCQEAYQALAAHLHVTGAPVVVEALAATGHIQHNLSPVIGWLQLDPSKDVAESLARRYSKAYADLAAAVNAMDPDPAINVLADISAYVSILNTVLANKPDGPTDGAQGHEAAVAGIAADMAARLKRMTPTPPLVEEWGVLYEVDAGTTVYDVEDSKEAAMLAVKDSPTDTRAVKRFVTPWVPADTAEAH